MNRQNKIEIFTSMLYSYFKEIYSILILCILIVNWIFINQRYLKSFDSSQIFYLHNYLHKKNIIF